MLSNSSETSETEPKELFSAETDIFSRYLPVSKDELKTIYIYETYWNWTAKEQNKNNAKTTGSNKTIAEFSRFLRSKTKLKTVIFSGIMLAQCICIGVQMHWLGLSGSLLFNVYVLSLLLLCFGSEHFLRHSLSLPIKTTFL